MRVQSITLQSAKEILLAKALEQHPEWKAEATARLNRTVSYALGESASRERFLIERAKAVLKTARESGLLSKPPHEPKDRFGLILTICLLVAFGLGAATDKLTATGNFINLLSSSFWGLIAWNLCAYILVALFSLGFIKPKCFPLRASLGTVLSGYINFPWTKTQTQGQYFTSIGKLLYPILQKEVSVILHLSAVAFTAGLIASIIVRGISTAFIVGWESTWFANEPATVKAIVDATYGLIPAGLGLPSLPDATALEMLRSDRLSYLDVVPSAVPWLVRMMVLIVILVIVPRLLLASAAFLYVRHKKAHIRLPLDDPYFVSLFANAQENTRLGELFLIVDKKAPNTHALKALTELWGNTTAETLFSMDFEMAPFILPAISTQKRTALVLLCFQATRTPEDELAGALLDAAKRVQAKDPHILFAAFLEMQTFRARQAPYPERVCERITSWRHYATERGFELFTSDEDPRVLVKNMRQWASSVAKKPLLPLDE